MSFLKLYGISISHLGGHSAEIPKAIKSKCNANYKRLNRDHSGGGLCRRPFWVKDILKSGGDIEKYRI